MKTTIKSLFFGVVAILISLNVNAQQGTRYIPTDPANTKINLTVGGLNRYSLVSDLVPTSQTFDYVITKNGSTVTANSQSGLPTVTGTLNSVLNTIDVAGASIFIRKGLYDNLDATTISNDGVTIIGEQGTILKAKNNLDAGATTTQLIYITANNITLRNLQLDGNLTNQSKVDNQITLTAKLNGIIVAQNSTNNLIDHCNVSNFPQFGVYIMDNANHNKVKNCTITNNAWNNVTLDSKTSYNVIEDNTTFGSGDVSITAYGKYQVIRNNIIGDVNGTQGSGDGNGNVGPYFERWGIAAEFDPSGTGNPTGTIITGNTISGPSINMGIKTTFGQQLLISNNVIHDLNKSFQSTGIDIDGGNGNIVSTNRIWNTLKYGISISASDGNSLIGNKIDSIGVSSADGNGIGIMVQAYGTDSSDNNFVSGNDSYGYYFGILQQGNYTKSVVINNKFNGPTYGDFGDVTPANTIRYGNYGLTANKLLDGDNTKANLAGPTVFTGSVTLPSTTIVTTQSAGNNTTAPASTAFVYSGLALKANLASPTFTGTPATVTASLGTNTTQIASTAFVQAAMVTEKLTRRVIADVNSTITSTDWLLAYTTLTATRTVTLGNASSYTDRHFRIKDESGNAGTNAITIVGTVNGVVNPTSVNAAYGVYRFYSNGTAWFSE